MSDDGVLGGHNKHGARGKSLKCSRFHLFAHVCAGQSGYTPLHYAARSGHLEAVTMLIKAGGIPWSQRGAQLAGMIVTYVRGEAW